MQPTEKKRQSCTCWGVLVWALCVCVCVCVCVCGAGSAWGCQACCKQPASIKPTISTYHLEGASGPLTSAGIRENQQPPCTCTCRRSVIRALQNTAHKGQGLHGGLSGLLQRDGAAQHYCSTCTAHCRFRDLPCPDYGSHSRQALNRTIPPRRRCMRCAKDGTSIISAFWLV